MIEIWRKQFTREQFLLTHKEPSIFLMSQWQPTNSPSIPYLGFRWVIALTFLITWLLSIILSSERDSEPSKWAIYLTNWGLTVCTAQALLAAIMLSLWTVDNLNTAHDAEQNKRSYDLLPYKLYWAMNTIATDLAFLITIVYWSLLFEADEHALDGMNVMSHAMNSCLMFLDLLVVAHPVRLVHCYLPVLFGLAYLIFSIIYWAAGGTDRFGNRYIYTILNWDNPGPTAAYCFGVLIFLLILHCFAFGTYQLRKFLYNKKTRRKLGEEEKSTPTDHQMKEVYVNKAMTADEIP